MKNSLFIFLLFMTISLAGFKCALACGSNQYKPSVCEMYGKSKAVFVGKIIGIEELKRENVNSDFRINFEVQKAFFGVKNSTEVSVILSGTSIEYCEFEKDRVFLVYAYKGDYGFSIDAGTRTKPIEDAKEDLYFLRSLPKLNTGIQLYGTVERAVKSSIEEGDKIPVSAMRLKIENTADKLLTFYAVTDENGHYEIRGIPSGEYKISPAKPLTKYFFAPEVGFGTVEVNDKGCIGYNFTLTTNNKFIGKIIDAEGNPVPHILVDILSVNAKRPNGYIGREYANTDSTGVFYAYNITPGFYTVSINYSMPPNGESPYSTVFYPGVVGRSQASIIEIKAGEEIKDFEFQLPSRLNERIVKGSVIWADGTPAVGVNVYLKDDEFDSCCIDSGSKTNEQGNFTLVGYEGRNYVIWSSGNKTNSNKNEIYGVSSPFAADKTKPQIITLNMTSEQFEKYFNSKENK